MRTFLSAAGEMEIAVEGLSRSGVRIAPGRGQPPAAVRDELARRALAHLMVQRCGRVSFRSEPDAFSTDPIPGCSEFERAMRVARIDGARVGDEGALAYRRVRVRCAAAEDVSLQTADGDGLATVPCDEELAPPPGWYRLGR